jgi:IgA Peptidase M64
MCQLGSQNHRHNTARPLPPKKISGKAPEAAYRVEVVKDAQGNEEILSVKSTTQTISSDKVLLQSAPYGLDCHEAPTAETYEESYVAESALTEAQQNKYKEELFKSKPEWKGSDVRTIVSQGPSDNRIDLTIVGDGYTQEQKARFFEDAARLTNDMFVGQTFASYLPLFNVHAVFVPSREAGLTDVERKDTALGLYRSPQGSKRGVMPGNRSAIERAIALAPDTDYPILVANDDFYGGLGGRYAITTRSHNSGTMVLRHELGHNFGNVGEEYDGGQVYRGANHSRSADVPWQQWMDDDGKVHEAESLARGYPWQNLSEGPVELDFRVPEGDDKGPKQIGIDVSSVGWESPEDVEILIDGKPQKYQGVYTEDRSFFRLEDAQSLAAGRHKLTVIEKKADGNNVVASVRINAYPADYDFSPNQVGGFPTFNSNGSHVGYRPTHESCLMRNMRSTDFCSVDQENMWHKFLNRVDLIDSIEATPINGRNGEKNRIISVETPELEGLDIRWFTDQKKEDGTVEEVSLQHLNGQKQWIAREGEDAGNYRVEVRFATDQVRQYSDRFRTTEDFSLS